MNDDRQSQLIDSFIAIVKELMEDRFVEPDRSSDTLHLFDDCGLDSLDLINFLFSIEENFEVRISNDEIAEHDLLNLHNLARFVAEARDKS